MPRPRKPETQALGLRLPVTLAERVRVAADASGRTWNAQVVHLIEAGFDVDAKARTTTSEKWGDALARSAATAAADAARDAVLRVAREFDDARAESTSRDAVLRVVHEAEQPEQPDRRVDADRRTHDAPVDPDPDLPLPAGTPTTDVYQVKGGFKVGRRQGERRADGEP